MNASWSPGTAGLMEAAALGSGNPFSIIPAPVDVTPGTGVFTITSSTVIAAPAALGDQAELLRSFLLPATGYPLFAGPATAPDAIVISLDANLDVEAYRLVAETNTLSITAASSSGVLHGIQTLRQLLPAEIFSNALVRNVAWRVPCVTINDVPRFAWRGLMLDCSRHFFGADYIRKFIDAMALHKMNVFHWHLTDDGGWRIEIKKYPKLGDVGAWRDEGGKPYGGIYTQAEVREIVAYAARLGIMIVPEIEMPGHSTAALAAHPDLSCTGGPFAVPACWGVFKDVYCAGNDRTFDFLGNVLAEVSALFPGTYIHIGGDECPKDRWRECPKCLKRMKDEGLKNEDELQSWFIRRIATVLASHGKRLVGWDEILEGGLAPDATVMSWRGTEGGIAAARAGHDVVMSPTTHCYFDYYQLKERAKEPKAIGGFLPLEQVYSFDPVPEELTTEESRHIHGVQGNIWTEFIATPGAVEYMAYPRGCAIAEVAWSAAARKDFADFTRRLREHARRLDNHGVHYRPLSLMAT